METLSDEIIHCILDSLDEGHQVSPKYMGPQHFLRITMHLDKDDTQKNTRNPFYNCSLVSHRIRRIALPFLFRALGIIVEAVTFPDDGEEITQFKTILARNADLARLVRHVQIIHSPKRKGYNVHKNYQFIAMVLAAFLELKCMQLCSVTGDTFKLDSQIPVIQAVNQHPSTDLCIVYPQLPRQPDGHLPSISLSRVVCFWHDSNSQHTQILVQELGLRILHIQFTHTDWHLTTYPAIISITRCDFDSEPKSDDGIGSIEMFCDFLDRHPSLRSLSLGKGFLQDRAPWNAALLNDLKPHTCVLHDTSANLTPLNHGGTQTSHWQLIRVTLGSLEVDPSLGVANLMAKLGAALPQVTNLSFENPRLGQEFNPYLFWNLSTKDIAALLGSNFPKVKTLHLSDTVFDNIVQEWSSEDENPHYEYLTHPASRNNFSDIQKSCETFLWNLGSSMPSLDCVSFRIWPNFVHRWQTHPNIGIDVHAYIVRRQSGTGNMSQQDIEVVVTSPASTNMARAHQLLRARRGRLPVAMPFT
ncbi:hypothetical protein K435DRAFT_784338 [Dendrothele bispora CBS 962.96]|uniref:Uncharacterized protein n=1 Tax=Dendrothele bispora (strain CBS 962.96) TaxID=1314807 RepID=A0A4S8L4W7_DENBC|nr:hypothetical protein K435DRAFT_784338 [Dendrothele bispora CBS 962.96]